MLHLLLSSYYAAAAAVPDPTPNPASVVVVGNARFTVLTERLLRLEWAEGARFEDRETLAFAHRHLPAPAFNSSRPSPATLAIDTAYLSLTYTAEPGGGASGGGGGGFARFAPHNLAVVVHATGAVWRPGTPAGPANLLGTVESLDGVTGGVDLNCANLTGCAAHDSGNPVTGVGAVCRYCTFAPISRDGWAAFDDTAPGQSGGAVIDGATGWIVPDARGSSGSGANANAPANANANATTDDTYLFGHGLDYRAALRDLATVTGPPGRVPREVLGTWWSRYWPYTAEELQDIARGYAAHGVPLDMVVSDMAWHYHNETPVDWAGYGWSKALFPAPRAFAGWLEAQRMNFTLNLHLENVKPPPVTPQPAWEAFVAAVLPPAAAAAATAANFSHALPCCNSHGKGTGCDAACNAATGASLNFSVAEGLIASQRFAQGYMSLLDTSGSRLQWLDDEPRWVARILHNHSRRGGGVGWRDAERAGTGLAFSRWAGLGSHRYPIGFSGDTYIAWASLAFQPYFTATAANVLFWWSHDIGGHRSHHDAQSTDSELYLRWLQWGAHAPILRTHPQPDPAVERRPWGHPLPFSTFMLAALGRRKQFVPLLHTKLLRFAGEGGAAAAAADANADDGFALSPLRPLYHDWPTLGGAYAHRDTYLWLDDLVVAPVTSPVDNATLLARRSVWLPPGAWVALCSGATHVGTAPAAALALAAAAGGGAFSATNRSGGLELQLDATINETPVFARAGSVLALAPAPSPGACTSSSSSSSSSSSGGGGCGGGGTIGAASLQPEQLLFEVYPGAGASAAHSGRGEEHVDNAFGRDDTTGGAYALSADGTSLTFRASCASANASAPGSCEAVGATPRVYRVDFKFVAPALRVRPCTAASDGGGAAAAGGSAAPGATAATTTVLSASYDARTLTQTVVFTLAAGAAAVTAPGAVACVALAQPGAPSFVADVISSSRYVALRGRAHRLKGMVDDAIPRPSPETMPLAVAINTAARIDALPESCADELGAFGGRVAAAAAALLTPAMASKLGPNVTAVARAWLA
jgi:hypothetical protein